MARPHRPEARTEPPSSGVVELRVHGVGGASPEEILDVPVTCLVAGDESAGFFRPWDPTERDQRTREAYSWGGLTSAARLRALWVLLAPFSLSNLAGWMLHHGGEPEDPRRRRREPAEAMALAAVRIFALVITVALAGFVAVGAVDLVAFQCGAVPACVDGRWWLSPWQNRFVAGRPERAVALGVVVAAAAVLAVAWLARRSQIRIHRHRSFQAVDDPALTADLHHAELWDSPHVAHRLGLIHTAAALTVVALTVAVSLPPSGGFSSVAAPAGWALLVGLVAGVAHLDGMSSRVHLALLAVSTAYLVALLVWLLAAPLPHPDGPLPGAGTVLAVLLPVYALAALVAGGGAYWLWRRHRRGTLRVALVGPGLLLLAAGLVNAFGSGLLIRLADLLGTPRAVAADARATAAVPSAVVYPDWVADVAVLTVLTLVVSAVVGGWAWIRAGHGPPCETLADRYAQRGGLDCADPGDRDWARTVGRAEAVAALTDRLAAVLGTIATVVLVIVAIAVVAAGDRSGLGLGSWTEPLAPAASVVLGLIPVLAVVGIARLYRSRAVRRVAGILWDVATFWPRWFHPWSPPSYGERAVPQLGHRLDALAGGEGVVLSAHSQGSVLAVATLAAARAGTVGNTSLLTHGSPLTRLYARYFPGYLSTGLFRRLAAEARGWVNLWRATDFIGGRIGAAGVADREVFDPPSTRAPSPGEPRPSPSRHVDYDRTDEYQSALAELVSRLR